ncbi:MAG: YihY/virulence factor BrkB family protein, partial [Calditrichia bacterium]
KRLLSLLMAHLVVKNFACGKSPLTAAEIGHILGIPIRLVRQVLYEFVQSRIFSTVVLNDEQDLAYQPAGDICKYSIGYVINKLEKSGSNNIPVPETAALMTLKGTLHTFARQIEKSPENKLLKDI